MIAPLSEEQIWEAILSRQPDVIRRAFLQLDEASRASVMAHLHKMAVGEGWQAEQSNSARIAIDALKDFE